MISTKDIYVIPGILLFIAILASRACAGQEYEVKSSEDSVIDGVFAGNQSGMFLWKTVVPFCGPLAEAVKEGGSGNKIKLMYSNDQQDKFFDGICGDDCDMISESNTMYKCSSVMGSGQCKLYAAVRGGIIYDLTVSADGSNIKEACGGQ